MTAELYFNGTPRPQQEDLFRQLRELWYDHDVIVVQAPPATGKTRLAQAFCRWAEAHEKTSAYVVPNGDLQAQAHAECPDFNAVRPMWSFRCTERQTSCDKARRRAGGKTSCASCPYEVAKASWRTSYMRLMNYHTLLSAKKLFGAYPNTVIFDEAHKLIDFQREQMGGVKLWRDKHLWPKTCDPDEVTEWLENCQAVAPHPERKDALSLLTSKKTRSIVTIGQELYRGKPKDVLRVLPLSVRYAKPVLWPRSVKKIIAISATINDKDVYELGWDQGRRVGYASCDSAIPAALRPFYFMPHVDMAYKNRELSLPEFARLLPQVLEAHPHERGLVHVTYEDAAKLRGLLHHPRYMWHTQDNKGQQLNLFKSAAGAGRVLMGSGLTEGVDLVGELARWQVISKVPALSLVDQVVKARAADDQGWYAWQSVKALLQAYGRVCRTPDDYGATYCFDVQFKRLYENNEYMFPRWFRDSVRW